MKAVEKDCQDRMDKALEALERHFDSLRTGRASLGLLDGVTVEAYGNEMPLNQVATLSTPDAKTIAIQPWDKSQLPAVEKALMAANLGMTPNNDGATIRMTVPPMTEERRKDTVKLAHKMAEEARVAIRNVRRHANDEIKKMEKAHEISEDDREKFMKDIQSKTDDHVKKIDDMLGHKEKEIMEV